MSKPISVGDEIEKAHKDLSMAVYTGAARSILHQASEHAKLRAVDFKRDTTIDRIGSGCWPPGETRETHTRLTCELPEGITITIEQRRRA